MDLVMLVMTNWVENLYGAFAYEILLPKQQSN